MTDESSPIARYHEATSRLEALIEATPTPTDSSREAVRERAAFRMGRLRRFLALLGNPHEGYPIVHVGGTSGKGSTSTAIAAILTAAGLNTGLHTSPYLQTPVEKLQINGQYIDVEHYIALTDTILALHEDWLASGEAALTYGEAWVALTALFFRESQVDIAVLEVGAGGRFDLTNVITPAVSVITSVGIDHTNTLGNTIPEIAWHKAGIIKPGIPSITAVTNPEALAIIVDEARLQHSNLTVIAPESDITDVFTNMQGTGWIDARSGRSYHSALRGTFQARNGATAVATIETLRGLGFHIPDEAMERGLQAARMPGRVEMVEDTCTVMLDGAHNAEKVGALAADVPHLLPVPEGGQRVAVLGVLEAKQALEMVEQLVPVIDVLVATSPQVTAKEGKLASTMAELAQQAGFHGAVWLEPEPRDAIAHAIELAGTDGQGAVLVTGSLYLIGNVRERWYREDDIVIARSSWP